MLRCIQSTSLLATPVSSVFDPRRTVRPSYTFRPVAESRRPERGRPDKGKPEDHSNRARSRHGKSIENKKRRRGRPAWTRKPDDTPFRDGNRDRLVGLLTERAGRTLCYYLSETNLNVHHWLMLYMRDHPIPRSGAWDDVSGETFLRGLLSMGTEHAKWTTGRDPLYDNIPGCGVDPRSLAQRIMDIRSQVALEFIEDLQDVSEENSLLLRETLMSSFSMNFDNIPVVEKPPLPIDQDKTSPPSPIDQDKKSAVAEKPPSPIDQDKKSPPSPSSSDQDKKSAVAEKPPLPSDQRTESAVAETPPLPVEQEKTSAVAETPPLPIGQDKKSPAQPSAFDQDKSSTPTPLPIDQDNKSAVAEKMPLPIGQDKKSPPSPLPVDQEKRSPQPSSSIDEEKKSPQASSPTDQEQRSPPSPSLIDQEKKSSPS